jgi:hypothetical protein
VSQPSSTTIEFTPEEIKEIEFRQREPRVVEASVHVGATADLKVSYQVIRWSRMPTRERRVPQPVRLAVTMAAPRERRDSSSSRSSGQDPGGGDDDPEPDQFRLVLVHQKHAGTAVQQQPRYCRCDRDKPYTSPNWDIGPDDGHCRSCSRPLRERDVRLWHAIARSERARLAWKGRSL